MRWFGIREARIPEADRDIFEQFGVNVIGAVLAGGLTPAAEEIQPVYQDKATRAYALKWMTEQYDRAYRKETWSLTMEAAITLFVLVELILSAVSFAARSR